MPEKEHIPVTCPVTRCNAALRSAGYLDRTEFASVMKSAKLGLNKKQIRKICAEADENEDGVIEYREFVPIMLDVISALKAAQVSGAFARLPALPAGKRWALINCACQKTSNRQCSIIETRHAVLQPFLRYVVALVRGAPAPPPPRITPCASPARPTGCGRCQD